MRYIVACHSQSSCSPPVRVADLSGARHFQDWNCIGASFTTPCLGSPDMALDRRDFGRRPSFLGRTGADLERSPCPCPRSESSPLEIVYLFRPDTRPPRLSFELRKPLVIPIRAPLPRSVIAEEPLLPTPSSLAITVPRSDEVRPTHAAAEIFVEKTEWDSGELGQTCARTFPQVARLLVGEGSVVLLALVEEDGRPSQTQVVQSSGDALRDQSVNACVLSFGKFEPALVKGRATASWERIHWTHRASMANAQ